MSAMLAAIGTAVGAGTGAAVATGASIAGSVLAGAAQGWMAKKQEDKAEQRVIDAENRRKATYDGVGDSLVGSRGRSNRPETAAEQIANQSPVGQKQRLGDIYKQRARQKRDRRTPRFTYNPENQVIESY